MKKLFAMMMSALVIGAVALSTGLVSTPCASAATAPPLREPSDSCVLP